jgi:MFS family permease
VTPPPTQPSYRALLDVPGLPRVVVAMLIARVAQGMVGVALVLFALAEYDSPELAGAVTLTSILPGLLVSPIAGALLDRHGRIRLVILDYLIALAALVLLGLLSIAGALPPLLLLAITIVSSLTSILSVTGLRSLFPLIVPKRLWERANAIDSNGYIASAILGPPIAAVLVETFGGAVALIVIGASFALAALALVGAPDPVTDGPTSGSLLRDAWDGLRYTWQNPTLRGLGFSISLLNVAGGMITIVIPLIVIEGLGAGEAAVGLVFAASGLTGVLSAFFFGRLDTRGREWILLVAPMILLAPTVAILLAAAGTTNQPTGLALVGLSQAVFGLLNGPLDIALFTIRQRRTDQALLGRAFAVSMAFNFIGYPIGAALTGWVAAASIEAAILVGILSCLVATVMAAVMIPRQADAMPVT